MTELAQQKAGAVLQHADPSPDHLVGPDRGFVSYRDLLNHQRYVNKFLEGVNASLDVGDVVEMRFESAAQRRERLYGWLRPHVLQRAIVLLDFAFHQVMPKLRLTKRVYFWLTRGRYRVLTATEVMGRVVSCAFEVEDLRNGSGPWLIRARKVGNPRFDIAPTYGPIVSLRRVGRGGRPIRVFKLRTMSPYAEYLQPYLHAQNGLQAGGKIARDGRITPWGRILRRFWIDELPMLWNLARGDVKLVGVRPLSEHYLSLYPDDLRALRLEYRPGLIPPFYADLPKTLEEIVESERAYLEAYSVRPLRTDFRYAMLALRNILFRGARSS